MGDISLCKSIKENLFWRLGKNEIVLDNCQEINFCLRKYQEAISVDTVFFISRPKYLIFYDHDDPVTLQIMCGIEQLLISFKRYSTSLLKNHVCLEWCCLLEFYDTAESEVECLCQILAAGCWWQHFLMYSWQEAYFCPQKLKFTHLKEKLMVVIELFRSALSVKAWRMVQNCLLSRSGLVKLFWMAMFPPSLSLGGILCILCIFQGF